MLIINIENIEEEIELETWRDNEFLFKHSKFEILVGHLEELSSG